MKGDEKNKAGLAVMVPLAFVAAVVPLITRLICIPLTEEARRQWSAIDGFAVFVSRLFHPSAAASRYWPSPFDTDLFTFWKAFWLVSAAAVLLVILAGKALRRKVSPAPYLLPLGLYASLIVLSAVLSDYRGLALFGFPGRYEGMYALLSCLVVFLAAAILADTRPKVLFVVVALAVSAALVAAVGLLQSFGHDPFQSEGILRALVVPENYYRLAKVKVRVLATHASSTLFNSNYLGMYTAMLLPLAASLLAASRTKGARIAWGALILLLAANLFFSGSRTAVLGLLAGAGVLLWLARLSLGKRGRLILVASALAGVLGLAVFLGDLPRSLTTVRGGNYLRACLTEGGAVIIERRMDTLRITSLGGQWRFADGAGRPIPRQLSAGEKGARISLGDPYGDYVFSLEPAGILTMEEPRFAKAPLRFVATNEGLKLLVAPGRLADLVAVPKVETGGLEGAASGRVFIWSRTLPLLPETIFVGKGPGTFAVYFPQHDYLGKLLAAGDMTRLYDKPHSLYLDIAFSTGLLSLACFLFLVFSYLREGLRLYSKGGRDFLCLLGMGLVAAVVSYLTTSLANDGFITVAPVFWVLFGLGVAVNRMVRSSDKKGAGLRARPRSKG